MKKLWSFFFTQPPPRPVRRAGDDVAVQHGFYAGMSGTLTDMKVMDGFLLYELTLDDTSMRRIRRETVWVSDWELER